MRIIDLHRLGRSQQLHHQLKHFSCKCELFGCFPTRKPNCYPQLRRNVLGYSGTTKVQAWHDLETGGTPVSLSKVTWVFTLPWTKTVLTKKEAPAPKVAVSRS